MINLTNNLDNLDLDGCKAEEIRYNIFEKR